MVYFTVVFSATQKHTNTQSQRKRPKKWKQFTEALWFDITCRWFPIPKFCLGRTSDSDWNPNVLHLTWLVPLYRHAKSIRSCVSSLVSSILYCSNSQQNLPQGPWQMERVKNHTPRTFKKNALTPHEPALGDEREEKNPSKEDTSNGTLPALR